MSESRNRTEMKVANILLGVLLSGLISAPVFGDLATLVDEAVLVEVNPQTDTGPNDGEVDDDETPEPIEIGTATNATYASTGGWAITSGEYIDKATYVFDLRESGSVSGATLILPVDQIFPQQGSAPIELEFFSSSGVIANTDYSNGFPAPIGQLDAVGLNEIRFDVTGAVNAALNTGRYVGFRVRSALAPDAVLLTSPVYTGVKFVPGAVKLEFVPGTPPATDPSTGSFNGYTLEVPNIDIPTIGEVYAQFKLVDVNKLRFELTAATVTGTGIKSPVVSGMQLFNCAAFSPPTGSATSSTGTSTYSINSGIIDIPDTTFQQKQFSVRMEYIEGTTPLLYKVLNFNSIANTLGSANVTDLDGGLVVEPTQDFIPACHGWVIIGDSIRNRLVERNLISGETGKVYPFNTIPNQLTLDEANGRVHFTVHPESTRLYTLDLFSGKITNNVVKQRLFGAGGASHEYLFSLRDLTIGENGNIFALMIDKPQFNPENSIPYAASGKWMGLMSSTGSLITDSIPLLEPIRIEYDPVRKHVFLATESNLATFDFSTATNGITFVNGTDVQVGSGCTDFSISPDGNRLAYSCPDGNDVANETGDDEFSIWDMDPRSYFNIDGEWFLENSPVSAVFNQEGTILIASDNSKLYFFDVVTHLLLEDFELGLLEDEKVKRIRFSKDGKLIIISLMNTTHTTGSKFLYMYTPALTGTPL